MCDEMLLAEEYCCPPPAELPCDVCADGITVDPTTSVGEGSLKTCGDLEIDSLVVEDGSDVCDRMRLTEAACCPSSPDTNATTSSPTTSPTGSNVTVLDEPSCLVCPDGVTVPADTSIGGDGKTCGTLIVDALTMPSSSVGCELMKEEQLTCCPAKAVNPCPVCPDGISVDGTTTVGSAGKTCADLLVDRENAEDDGDTCAGMFEVAAPVCCPSIPTVSPTSGGGGNGTAPAAR